MAVGLLGSIHYTKYHVRHSGENVRFLYVGRIVNGKKQSPNSQANAPRKLNIIDSPLDWVITATLMSGSTRHGSVPMHTRYGFESKEGTLQIFRTGPKSVRSRVGTGARR